MNIRTFGSLLLSIGVCQIAGLVGAVFSMAAIDTWYQTLVRPALAPPDWIFGPVWTLLYTLMGISAFLVWEKGGTRPGTRMALGIFAVQLTLNALWSFLFFGLQNPGLALIGILALLAAILLTIRAFWRISRVAAILLLPYVLWVLFATYLNYSFWVLN